MWKKRRLIGGILQALLVLGLPFVRVGGEGAIRFDIPGGKLHLFGSVIWINEFHIVLVFLIFVTLFFVIATNLFGRVWCGWACPQTVIPLLTSRLAGSLPVKRVKSATRLLLLPVTALVSMSILWYFIPPALFLESLCASSPVAGIFLVQWLVIYLGLAFWGSKFCATVCPYSMIQNVLFDEDTLVVEFDQKRRPCLECSLCEVACPVGIDIKDGLQRECTACAGCVDACTGITGLEKMDSFISYRGRFGRGKLYLFGALVVCVLLVSLYGAATRPKVHFFVNRVSKAPGSEDVEFRYLLQNNTDRSLALVIQGDRDMKVGGMKEIFLPGFARREGKITLSPPAGARKEAHVILKGKGIEQKRRVAIY